MKRPTGKNAASSGFTIIEVLIVLAVTSALFLSAVFLISGRQNVASFNQSIRNVQTELQQIVGEIGSGFYPNDGSIRCIQSAGRPLLSAGGTDTQGTNRDCTFLGKALQFGVQGTAPQTYNIYTIVGLKGNTITPSVDLASSAARLIAKGSGEATTAIPDQFATKNLLYGLTVADMYYNGNPGSDIGAFGFASSQSSLGSTDGSQQIDVIAITGTALNATKETGVTEINDNLATSIVNPEGGVQICFNSGATNQSGLISIGGAGRQGTVNLKIFSSLGCV